jgi:hypothetical protein
MLKGRKLFLAGLIGSVAVAIALASLFSSMAASAQMMAPMQNQTNTAMQHKQNYPSKGHDMGMFSVMGMSMAKNVTITGVSVTGDNEVTVNVRYTGNGTATPGIGIFVMTNGMGMMHNMMMSHMGAMMYGQNFGMAAGNSMMGQQWNNSTMMQGAWAGQNGSNFVKGGWTASGDAIKIKLDGTGVSAYNAHNICVMVSPYMG